MLSFKELIASPYDEVIEHIDSVVDLYNVNEDVICDEDYFEVFSDALIYIATIMLDSKFHTEDNKARLMLMISIFYKFDSSFVFKAASRPNIIFRCVSSIMKVNHIKAKKDVDYYLSDKGNLLFSWFLRRGSLIILNLFNFSAYLNILMPLVDSFFGFWGSFVNILFVLSYSFTILRMLWAESSNFHTLLKLRLSDNKTNYIIYPYFAVSPLKYCVLSYNHFSCENYMYYSIASSFLITLCSNAVPDLNILLEGYKKAIDDNMKNIVFASYLRNSFCKRALSYGNSRLNL